MESTWQALGKQEPVRFHVGGEVAEVSLGDIRARVVADECPAARDKRMMWGVFRTGVGPGSPRGLPEGWAGWQGVARWLE